MLCSYIRHLRKFGQGYVPVPGADGEDVQVPLNPVSAETDVSIFNVFRFMSNIQHLVWFVRDLCVASQCAMSISF